MCAYVMEITDLDPLKHGLIFERFLNPDAASMPDLDIDFAERRLGDASHHVPAKHRELLRAHTVPPGPTPPTQRPAAAPRVGRDRLALG